MIRRRPTLSALALLASTVLLAGCSGRDAEDLPIARAPIDPVVFADDLDGDVYPQPFAGTYEEALSVDETVARDGTASIKVIVPGEGSSLGAWSGGVLTSVGARDFADYNALTFYAKSSVATSLNTVGFGNDNTGNSLYGVERANVALGTDWTFVVLPIPNSSRLIAERGLFTYAEGYETAEGHTIWFDEIRFAQLGNIADPHPVLPMTSNTKQCFVGATVSLSGAFTRYSIDGAYVAVSHAAGYFDFTASDPAVAVVEDGEIRVVGVGTSAVTAMLNGVDVNGGVLLTCYDPPADPAPTPAHAASDVISLFSDVYDDETVDQWNPSWGAPSEMDDYAVAGNAVKMFSALTYAGIDFANHTLDVTGMTHLHVDVFAPAGSDFKVKIVAFDGDVDAGGALVEQIELSFDETTTPAFTAGAWSSLEIPLADYGFSASLDHIAQLVISTADARLVLVDNIYWHR